MTKIKTNQRACRICRRGRALQGVRCNACQQRLNAAITTAIQEVRRNG
jgi:hypothetical protein